MGNEQALNKYLQKQEQMEKFLIMFQDEIDDDLMEITELINGLRKKASDYYGYDFREECEEWIHDLI